MYPLFLPLYAGGRRPRPSSGEYQGRTPQCRWERASAMFAPGQNISYRLKGICLPSRKPRATVPPILVESETLNMLRVLKDTSPAQEFPRLVWHGQEAALLHLVGEEELTFVFPLSKEPELEVGAELTGSLQGPLGGGPVELAARVLSCSETRIGWFVRVGVDEQCIGQIQQLVERRGARRIALDSSEPVECLVKSLDGDEGCNAQAVNVSMTGIRLRVMGSTPGWLADSEHVHITCVLPRDEARFEVDAAVRYRRTDEQGTSLGLEFELRSAKEYVSFIRTVEEFSQQRLELALAQLGQP